MNGAWVGTRAIRLVVGACTIATMSRAVQAQPGSTKAVPAKEVVVLEWFDFHRSAVTHAALPRQLKEISGLAATPDGRVFAHDDERAVVYQLDPCAGKITKSFTLGSPAVRGDFEGIAIADDRFFLITSVGHLLEFREGADGATVPFSEVDTGFGRECELEGLAYEPMDRSLLIGCKQSLLPALRGQVTLLRWSLDRKGPATPDRVSFPLVALTERVGATHFRPSTVEREARTGHYLMVAGPERVLAEVTPTGKVIATLALRRQLHLQPEGLTLLGDSVLVISDEGGTGRGSITCYRPARR